jgi:hypothetical protein
MPPYDLNPCFQRVVRAEEHLANLWRTHDVFLRGQENSLVCYFDPEPPHRISCTQGFSNPPMMIGVLIGEVCYNLRSALDYLVFQLAKLDSGVAQDGTQFLIEDRKKGFEYRKNTKLAGLNANHIAMIEILQPYNGCQWAQILRDLSNWDKHRDFALIGGGFRALGYTPDHPDFTRVERPIRSTSHPIHGKMDVKVEIIGSIEFPDGKPAFETLEVVKLGVSETLKAFQSDFIRA